MKHIYAFITVLVFLFTVEGHAQQQKKQPKKARTKVSYNQPKAGPRSTISTQRKAVNSVRTTQPVSVEVKSAPAKANIGKADCPFKNQAFSPFSKEGKYTQRVAQTNAPNHAPTTSTY